MSQKRNFPGPGSGRSLYTKRARPSYAEDGQDDDDTQNSITPYERPRNHPVFGQKSAFPGLDTTDGDELFYGPAEDGLEYLRMVRSEASSLPTLFNAPAATEPLAEAIDVTVDIKSTETQTQQEETLKEEEPNAVKRVPEGVYSDGVYVGLAAVKPVADRTISDAQASYYNLLHHRFLLLRSILKCTPPPEAISMLDDSHPISFPRSSKNAQKEWRRLLLQVDPQTAQLACMDMDSVLGVLVIVARLMSENVRDGNVVLVRRIGAWAWGLLGKCRDAGQLGAREIGDIRELGKRAVKILQKIGEEQKEVREEEEEEYVESDAENDKDDQGLSGEKGEESIDTTVLPDPRPDAEKEASAEELEQAKARLEARISATGAEPISQEEAETEAQIDRGTMYVDVDVETQTHAMLDMIITIIGEHYGQRDLLEARDIWTEGKQRFM
ncbi:hypothetical protein BJX76DRAFT_335377 [Aspergillus varians]